MATGDGGMIVTRDKKIYDRLMKLRWMGISRDTWDRAESGAYHWDYNVEELGFKYQMNDIAAAIGLVQLWKLEAMNQKRRELAARYRKALAKISGVQFLAEKPGIKHAQHNFIIKTVKRDALAVFLQERQISTGVHYRPNNHYAMYRGAGGPTPVADAVWKQLLTLPLYPTLSFQQQDYVVRSIAEFFEKES
jgi:perosamine synthetase